MTRILVTGANGQIGWELQRTLAPLGTVIACNRRDLDLCDVDRLADKVRDRAPDLIVNAAAYTDVDRAEDDEAIAMRVNAQAPRVLAEVAADRDAWLIHFSTDYVYDGDKAGAYDETDTPRPLNVYGRGKLAGEQAIAAAHGRHLILRTSWVYAERGNNFLCTMLRLAAGGEPLRIVDDQYGAPTWARLIAEATAQIAVQVLGGGREADAGVYHLTCGGKATWYEFARAIFTRAALARQPGIEAVATRDYPTRARRPLNSMLNNDKLERVFGVRLPDWRAALDLCLADH